MPTLKDDPTLADLQQYVRELEQERGFAAQGPLDKCLLLGEEVGELFKAVRKALDMGVDAESKVGAVADELADVLIYLCSVANRFDVPLEKAFRDKERVNKGRTWE